MYCDNSDSVPSLDLGGKSLREDCGRIIYDIRSKIMPSDSPHSLSVSGDKPFSMTSCVLVGFLFGFSEDGGEVEDGDEGAAVSRMMAGNSMLPTKARMRYRKAAELRGAIWDAASTVTEDHLGEETSDMRGTQ